MNVDVVFNDSVSIGQHCATDLGKRLVERFLSLFYILSPFDNTYDNSYDVPNYEVALLPAVGFLLIVEQIVRLFQKKSLSRFEDIAINIGSAVMFTLTRVYLLSVVIVIFTWIHNNFRIVDLPLHSVWTWILCILLVEFVYYWTHRALHEFNILWAAHQFHHMAEDVNITTAIRDSIFDLIVYNIFPLPLAVIIPPPILVVHIQFSLIYQIWLHNEVVGNLGFIEYIINTPRQHRVHHGKNPYCIDKNYGALIMIWDRMFGTYQTEKEKIIFGVVSQTRVTTSPDWNETVQNLLNQTKPDVVTLFSPTPKTFDSLILQFRYYKDLWVKFKTVEGFGNKMSALFKGPRWAPGKPRLGLISDVPEPDPSSPKYSYDPNVPLWKKVYVSIHGYFAVLAFFLIADHPNIVRTRFSPLKGIIGMFYIIFMLTSIGAIFDNRKRAPVLEIVRCIVYFPFEYYIIASVDWHIGLNETLMLWFVRLIHIVSIIFWILYDIKDSFIYKREVNHNCIASQGEKGIESDNSSKRNPICQTWFLIFGFILMVVIFFIAWGTRLDSCTLMLNQW